jgi:cytochrome oxidase Cu insertion factor (SCO1/SenC/PrrC family)
MMVRIWITVMLVALMVLTGVTVWRITRNPDMRPSVHSAAATDAATAVRKPDEPLDMKSFEMTERSGEKFNFEKLKGQVWIASMFFSSCPHECSSLNTAISTLRKYPEFAGVKFVSITVDPAVDTPERLTEYAENFGADQQWLFLRGDLNDISRFGEDVRVAAGYRTHVRSLIPFDRAGVPQGFYHFNDPADIAALREKIVELKDAPQEVSQEASQEATKEATSDRGDPASS